MGVPAILERQQLQDELAAGADGELVGVQEGAQVGAGHGEGLDELGAVGARARLSRPGGLTKVSPYGGDSKRCETC